MFRNIRVHPCSSRWSWGIKQLVETVFLLEKITPTAELDIFVLSISDMCEVHYSGKGLCRPTDALTFHEDKHTRETVHALLFNGDPTGKKVAAKSITENKMSNSFFEQQNACVTRKHATDGLGIEVLLEESHQLSAWINAKRYERSRAAIRHLGEIYLCPSYMKYRLQYYPLNCLPSFPMYMQAAIVHALLHALGEDHETPQELQHMIKKEQQIGMHLTTLARRSHIFSSSFLFGNN